MAPKEYIGSHILLSRKNRSAKNFVSYPSIRFATAPTGGELLRLILAGVSGRVALLTTGALMVELADTLL